MYIGSVRFFKHIILCVIALLIIVPTAGCFYFVFECNSLKSQVASMQAALREDAQNADAADKQSDSFAVYASDELSEPSANAISYQLKYPQLHVENDFKYITEAENTVYLTFDDGPSGLTPQVLDILKEHGLQATFFVVYKNSDDAKALYKRVVDEGHTLAIHSATHEYKKIYQSVEAFLDDFALLSDMLEDLTGVKPELFRFPGGSINNYNKEIHQELVAEMLRRGYTYYDWDISSGSSTKTATAVSVHANVMNGLSGKKRAIILMHDAGSPATVTALPDIIESIKASGYSFGVLNKTIKPTCFDYSN